MSDSNFNSLGDAISRFLKHHGIEDSYTIQEMIADWELLMGKPIANNTERIWFKNNILYVRMSSAVWRQELSLARLKIKDMINKKVGKDLVQEVKIL